MLERLRRKLKHNPEVGGFIQPDGSINYVDCGRHKTYAHQEFKKLGREELYSSLTELLDAYVEENKLVRFTAGWGGDDTLVVSARSTVTSDQIMSVHELINKYKSEFPKFYWGIELGKKEINGEDFESFVEAVDSSR